MTAPTTTVRGGETWPVTRAGWTALIDAMQDNTRTFPPGVAQVLGDALKVARLHASDMPEQPWSTDDVRGFAGVYGDLIRFVRDQAQRAGPVPAADAADLVDCALTDFVLARQRDATPGQRVNLTGAGTHIVAYLAEHNTALHPTGGPQ